MKKSILNELEEDIITEVHACFPDDYSANDPTNCREEAIEDSIIVSVRLIFANMHRKLTAFTHVAK